VFEGLGGGGIEFWNSPSGGLAAADYVVRGNSVADSSRMIDAHPAIYSSLYPTGADHLHGNLLFEKNRIGSATFPAILLRDAKHVVFRENSVVVAGNPRPEEYLSLVNSIDVTWDGIEVPVPTPTTSGGGRDVPAQVDKSPGRPDGR
jgi:hypothetical protein